MAIYSKKFIANVVAILFYTIFTKKLQNGFPEKKTPFSSRLDYNINNTPTYEMEHFDFDSISKIINFINSIFRAM